MQRYYENVAIANLACEIKRDKTQLELVKPSEKAASSLWQKRKNHTKVARLPKTAGAVTRKTLETINVRLGCTRHLGGDNRGSELLFIINLKKKMRTCI